MPALNVSTASTSLMPSGERPGVPAGTSSGGRQNVIFDVPSACSAPAVRSKNAASSSALPAHVSLKTQYAVCVVVPVHESPAGERNLHAADEGGPGRGRTSISPGTGTIAPPRSRARTRASAVPMVAPTVPPVAVKRTGE